MKALLILLISAAVLLSIAEAASTSKKESTAPVSSRNARKYSYKDLVALMDEEEKDEDELDDEEGEDDDDDDDENDLDDESGSSGFGGARFPQFHELFPNPDGRPAGPNSYEAYIKHMPKAQQQGLRQPSQGHSYGRPPPSPVRRVDPVYSDSRPPPPPPRRRKISTKKSKKSKKKKTRPTPVDDDDDDDDAPTPEQYYYATPPQGELPQGQHIYGQYQQQSGPPPGPPQYYEGAPPPHRQQYYEDDAPQRGQNHYQGQPINFQQQGGHQYQQGNQGGPQYGNQNQGGYQPGYPVIEQLPQGNEATSWFEFPSSLTNLFRGVGRTHVPNADQHGVLSRRLLSESDEVSSDSDSPAQVVPEAPSSTEVQEESPKPSKVTQPTLFNRPGHGSNVRPGFGSNRYYIPSSQDTRYFRPITNRLYSDYSFVPQGAFVMDGYRPSYRPRYETSLEQSPRQIYRPYVTAPVHGAQYYTPWSNNRRHGQYVVNPSEMSRRRFRYQSQRAPVARVPFYNGYWGNARNTFVGPWSGSRY